MKRDLGANSPGIARRSIWGSRECSAEALSTVELRLQKRRPKLISWAYLCATAALQLSVSSVCAEQGASPSRSNNTSAASSGHILWLQPGAPSDFPTPGKPIAVPRFPTSKDLEIGSVTGYVVRVAYIIPANRIAQVGAVTNLRTAMLQYQSWYADQMERNGFGRKTFRLEMEADRTTPRIYTVPVAETDNYLRGDLWGRTSTAAASAGVPLWTPKQVWFLISEAHVEAADGSVTGGTALGASFGSGDDPGVAMLGGDALARFAAGLITNDLAYNNQYLAAIGPYPLKQNVSFPGFEGATFSSVSSSVLGAGIHETSHAFGLPHDFRNDRNFNGNLMGNGLRGFRGALYPARYSSDYTRAAYGSALILNVSRYFNPDGTYTDNTRPALNVTTTGTNSPVNGLLRLSFTASDASGLSAALLQLNGDAVGEMPLSGTSVSQTFTTAYYTPGQTNQFTVSVWDTRGNKQSADTFIVPRTGFNRAPQPSMTLLPPTALVGQNVILDASASTDPDGSLASVQVEWDLRGDGVFDTALTTTKTLTTNFTAASDRLIRCRLTDSSGAQAVSAPLALRLNTPALAISRSGTSVRISWSTNAAGFALQSTAEIATANWQAVTQALLVINGQNTLVVSNAIENQFFRLKR